MEDMGAGAGREHLKSSSPLDQSTCFTLAKNKRRETFDESRGQARYERGIFDTAEYYTTGGKFILVQCPIPGAWSSFIRATYGAGIESAAFML